MKDHAHGIYAPFALVGHRYYGLTVVKSSVVSNSFDQEQGVKQERYLVHGGGSAIVVFCTAADIRSSRGTSCTFSS
jgi:hypothetical protein